MDAWRPPDTRPRSVLKEGVQSHTGCYVIIGPFISHFLRTSKAMRLASFSRISQCDLNWKKLRRKCPSAFNELPPHYTPTNPPSSMRGGFEAVWLGLWAVYCTDPICWYNMPQCSHECLATLMNFVRHYHILQAGIYKRWFYSCCHSFYFIYLYFVQTTFKHPSGKATMLHKESLTNETLLLLPCFCINEAVCESPAQTDVNLVCKQQNQKGKIKLYMATMLLMRLYSVPMWKREHKQSYIHLRLILATSR